MARKYHDEAWLREQYLEKEKSSTQISREIGVTKGTILNWLHRHDIPTRSRGPQKGSTPADTQLLQDEEWLRTEYIEKEKSTHQIAKENDYGDQTVLNWLENHEIETRSGTDLFHQRSSAKDARLEDEEWLRTEYKEKERTMSDIARELDVSPPAVKYRLDECGIERRDSYWDDGGDTVFQRDPEWEDRREKRLEVDGYTCQDCGISQEDHYRSLDVHHLQKKEEFVESDGSVDWAAANAVDNMVSLCQSCHVKRHRN